MAKTAIKKSFSIGEMDDENEDGEKPESEGTKKVLDGVFESMMPLSGGKNKKGRDESDDEDPPSRRRQTRAGQSAQDTTKKEDPDAEMKKEVSKVIKGSGPVLGTLHHTMYTVFHVKNPCPG